MRPAPLPSIKAMYPILIEAILDRDWQVVNALILLIRARAKLN